MKSLLLDRTTWDLVIGSDGNIALAGDPYARAQNVANAGRLFLGELYYDTAKGVPYFQDILGYSPPIQLIQARMVEAALTVAEVVSAEFIVQSIVDRKVTGQIRFVDIDGNKLNANIN